MIGATLVAMEVSVCTKLQTLSSDQLISIFRVYDYHSGSRAIHWNFELSKDKTQKAGIPRSIIPRKVSQRICMTSV